MIRQFARRAGERLDPSTSINVLTGIQRHLGADPPVLPTSREPELAEFILDCLAQPPLVQSAAVDLLLGMSADGVLRGFGSHSWTARLRRTVKDLGRAGAIAETDEGEVLAALDGDR